MIKLRHPTRSFNFKRPGETFEVYDKDVNKYVNRYGCELVELGLVITDDPAVIAENREKIIEDLSLGADEVTDVRVNDIAVPIQTSPGWWLYEGKKYRKAKLPAAGAALLE
jgi:hypothetical protein